MEQSVDVVRAGGGKNADTNPASPETVSPDMLNWFESLTTWKYLEGHHLQ